MENLVLSAENILNHLRQNQSNKKDLQIIKLLEKAEKHASEIKTEQYRILEELLQVLLCRGVNTLERSDGGTVFSCVVLLTCLQEQQKLPCLNDAQFSNIWKWLGQHYKCNEILDTCRIIIAIGNLFSMHPENCNRYFAVALQMLLTNIVPSSSDVLLITSLQCLNKILSTMKDVKLSDEQSEVCSETGSKLLQLHYGDAKLNINISNISIIIQCTLEVLNKITALNSKFAKLQTAELLGLSKTYFAFGLDGSESLLLKPQKVYVSPQGISDAKELRTETEYGGKTPKTRKPRAVVKTNRSSKYKTNNRSPENKSLTLVFDMITSDSEISEPENATNRILFERNRKSKIRIAAVSLVGSIVSILDRETLFGYWHALFPSGTADIDNLLYIGQRDPNLRCRAAALQVCAVLICGSKGYLHQAEMNSERCPTTFIPFSVNLGYTVLAIYKFLTTILSSESSLAVLTQALKCLAVLVQASPLKKFEKGFVQDFVKHVKPLVYHRDAAIQVSALMVMEFLVALPETTSDIAEAIGLTPEVVTKRRKKLLQHVDDEEIDIFDSEEFVECEEEEDNLKDQNIEEPLKTELHDTHGIAEQTSWLLLRVLHNLSKQDKMMPTTSVRIESLQVLNVMSRYFSVIKPHLTKVADVLLYSLNDNLPDVRLYAARCLDACAYQINRFLLDNSSSCSEAEIRECNKFWLNMLPFIMGHIRRQSEEMTTVRITLCDALSNIGAIMYEYTPHSNQISLLSFLSGISSESSEDTLLRAAGVRALAVYAQYPSLRGDLVFIENTAELTLHLLKDSNLLVRVKSLWSLANISDALIGKETEMTQLRQERISDDLLYRLINATTTASSDNDKVRCNAVRTLGNLLRLLNHEQLNGDNVKYNWRQTFAKSISKLSDCLRSSGNAKVKWNTCYAITNAMRNRIIFTMNDLSWQGTLFVALCHVIVNHSNFKVRINATAAITNIFERTHFGNYYEKFWLAVLEAIEQSYNLDNFCEYNHRDSLQEQLCLSLAHIMSLAINDDLAMLSEHLMPRQECIQSTWKRVINRIVPEKAAPLLSCPVDLLERLKQPANLTVVQKNCLNFLIETFKFK